MSTTQPAATVVLKPKREKSLLNRHPWVFSGAIARATGSPRPGDTVDVRAADGRWLARGAYSPHSQIRVRVWTFDRAEAVDESFLRRRLERAFRVRNGLKVGDGRAAMRLVNAEGDFLPGVVIDRYADFLVGQFLSAGAEFWKDAIVSSAMELSGAAGFYERSEGRAREKEGLAPAAGLLAGREPPELVEIEEGRGRFLVDDYALADAGRGSYRQGTTTQGRKG